MSLRTHHFLAVIATIGIVTVGVLLSYTRGNAQTSRYFTSVPPVTDPAVLAALDTDNDKLTDAEEMTFSTNPQLKDTDGDGLSDYDEVKVYHTKPLVADSDNDGYLDGDEIRTGTSPLFSGQVRLEDADTDGDGLNDAIELSLGTDLSNSDTDTDGTSDRDEAYAGFNPLVFGQDRSVERYVEVNLNTQELYYFMNGVKLGTMPISTGLPSKPTPRGEFAVRRKVPIARYVGREPGDEYDLPNVKWNLEFKPAYFLHSAYWHNQFGVRAMSHGCVNMRVKDAEQIYTFLDVGDKVIVYGKTPVGKVKKDPLSIPSVSTSTGAGI